MKRNPRYKTEALAMIQVLTSEIQNAATCSYITDPARLSQIQDILLDTRSKIAKPIAAFGSQGCSSSDDCPDGWECRNGLCKPGRSTN